MAHSVIKIQPTTSSSSGARDGEMEALGERLDRQIEAWFAEGPGREWTDDDWAALKRGELRHPPEADSPAVPPGWKSSRLK